jgi:hypothetical protein
VGVLEDWKIKIVVLWSVFEFCVIAATLVLSIIPTEVVAETPPEEVFLIAVTLLIPPVMSFLSLSLKDRANRWVNIILSIFFVVTIPFGTGFGLIPTAYLPSIVVIAIVEFATLALIIWFAWKSKQRT